MSANKIDKVELIKIPIAKNWEDFNGDEYNNRISNNDIDFELNKLIYVRNYINSKNIKLINANDIKFWFATGKNTGKMYFESIIKIQSEFIPVDKLIFGYEPS